MTLITLEQCEAGGNIVILGFHSQGQLPPFQAFAAGMHLSTSIDVFTISVLLFQLIH